MMNHIWRALCALALAAMAVSPAAAREAYSGFVKETYYLGHGGTPATFEQVVVNPSAVFRSDASYMNLRAHVGSYLGRPLTDEDFRALLRSAAVRLIPCEGSIDTAGVSNSGRFGWRLRKCYLGEKLIELKLQDGSWVVVASQGCYNPVRGKKPTPPPAALPPPITGRWQCDLVETGRNSQQTPATLIPGSMVMSGCCNCTTGTFISPLMVGGGNQTNSSTSQQRCVWINGSN